MIASHLIACNMYCDSPEIEREREKKREREKTKRERERGREGERERERERESLGRGQDFNPDHGACCLEKFQQLACTLHCLVCLFVCVLATTQKNGRVLIVPLPHTTQNLG